MAKYSLDPVTANCYPGTSVLINKFGITNEEILENVEADITEQRILLWNSSPRKDSFDFEHYKAIHKFLFDELYDWAGEVRTVNISKKGTRFCDFHEVEDTASKIFTRLNKLNRFRDLAYSEFIDEFVDFYVSTNELHPFREGNGRTQRAFLNQLVAHAGYELKFSEIDIDDLMIATIQSSQGVVDGLKRIFINVIQDRR